MYGVSDEQNASRVRARVKERQAIVERTEGVCDGFLGQLRLARDDVVD